MTNEPGQFLWLFMDVILLVALGAALIYGMVMWSRRRQTPGAKQVRDQGTERIYREAEQQDRREIPS
jgi:hypothetical protein